MQATQYHNSGSHAGSKAGQIKRKRHNKFQEPEGNLNNNNSMVVLPSLSLKVLKFKNLFSSGCRRYEILCVLEWLQRKKVTIKF